MLAIRYSSEWQTAAFCFFRAASRLASRIIQRSAARLQRDGKWELSKGKLYDVTHLPCRSALYTPATAGAACTPAQARPADFPVKPGAAMPAVSGCAKQDYAVLFVVGVEA